VQLRDILEQYGSNEFQRRIGFDYFSIPSDLAPGKFVRRVSSLLHMDVSDAPITEAAVRTRVRRIVQNEMILDQWVEGKTLPSSCSLITLLTVSPPELVVNALSQEVYEITKESVLNAYNSNPFQRLFRHQDSRVFSWFTRGIITYANGQDFEGGRRYRAHIVHLFLVRAHSPPA